MRGGSLKQEALAYLKSNTIDPDTLLKELLQKNDRQKSMGGFVFKGKGSAHSFDLQAKKEGNNDSQYVSIHSVSDH